ncbi:MAG: VirB8/TrbF family protein, partial [Pseudomonadota bacterium]
MSNTASDGRFSSKPGDIPITPYQKAADAWDERIGSARVQAKNWRLAALLALGAVVLLVGALVYQAGQAKVTPFMVQVDNRGAVVGAGPVQTQPLAVNDRMVRYFMTQVVTDMRTLPLDPVIARENWLKVYQFLGPASVQKMNAIAHANDPFAGLGERTRTV